MKTLYLDLFSGISGDMFIGALLDLGVDPQRLENELLKLGLDGYHLHVSRQQKGSLEGVKFDVHLAEPHDHHVQGQTHSHERGHHRGASASHGHEHGRCFADIKELIARSPLSNWVKDKATAIFQRLADAEGKIHGVSPDQVHFHEVGAVDSIVDIVGACIALELLGCPRLVASRVVDGNGWVDCAHGRFPIPAPATLAVLGARGIPLSQCDEPFELVTPTGAALLAELVEQFAPMQDLAPEKIGFGLGSRENKSRPNVLRAILGTSSEPAAAHDWETDKVVVLETNLDDINAEILGHFVEQALAAGALDVFCTPAQMKKNRPGILLTLLCAESDADHFSEMILRETTSFGVRRHIAERRKLRREFAAVTTPYGEVTIKLGRLDGQVVQAAPEFASCKKLAAGAGVPIKTVYEAAVKAWETHDRP